MVFTSIHCFDPTPVAAAWSVCEASSPRDVPSDRCTYYVICSEFIFFPPQVGYLDVCVSRADVMFWAAQLPAMPWRHLNRAIYSKGANPSKGASPPQTFTRTGAFPRSY